jgi:hypothetical protein
MDQVRNILSKQEPGQQRISSPGHIDAIGRQITRQVMADLWLDQGLQSGVGCPNLPQMRPIPARQQAFAAALPAQLKYSHETP